MKNKIIPGFILILVAAFSFSFAFNALGAKGVTKSQGQNFLTVSMGHVEIENSSASLIISGGSFTVEHAYCATPQIPGDGMEIYFTISVNSTTIGTCTINGNNTFSSTTLAATDISPGTLVRIDTYTTSNINTTAAVTIAP